ncbi:hypothetical protein [Undibacterium pigrum]|uniref:Uncharacterized protein n=1 Tax=Undibacterium pigrum TaxID=401470 RepID=A0A318JBN0_9BURK|nr:hypothetical protein [Undibacterium pigrum]PXX44093.1 hypothetical protein DFR42_103362 [Undibacterium pigrum]
MTTPPSPIASEFAKVEEAEAYDAWFLGKVQKFLHNPSLGIHQVDFMVKMQAIIYALKKSVKFIMKKNLASPVALKAQLFQWRWMIGALLGGFSGLVHAVDANHHAEIFLQSGHGGSAMEDARFVDTDRYLISAGRDGKAVL